MAGVGVKIDGLKALGDKMRATAAALESGLDRAVMRGALLIAGQAQRNVTTAGTGAGTQRKEGGTGLHVRTGRLRQSIGVSLLGPGVARVGTNVIYAAIHEFGGVIRHPGGTAYFPIGARRARWISNAEAAAHGRDFPRTRAHNIPIRPRPYMRPALNTMRARVVAEIRKVYAGPLGLGEVRGG